MICFQVWFWFFFSYSIKLLAVQELLDKEALEKVNILLFLPHLHKQQSATHEEKSVCSQSPETALMAKVVPYFVFGPWDIQNYNQNSPIAHTSFTLASAALLVPLGLCEGRGLACDRVGHTLERPSVLQSTMSQRPPTSQVLSSCLPAPLLSICSHLGMWLMELKPGNVQ